VPINTSIAEETWQRFTYLRENGHRQYMDLAKKCEEFFAGVQWDPRDLALLKAQRRPALTINQILRTVSNVLGEQIFNRTDISYRPRNEGATSEVADALTKVFMQIADNNQLAWQRSDLFCDGIITGRGYIDARLDFTDSLRGEVRLSLLNPRNVMPDSDADNYDPDTWQDVVTTRWMSADDIELLYSKADADILRNRFQSGFMAPYAMDSFDDRERFGNPRETYTAFGIGPLAGSMRSIRVIERQYKKLDRVDHFVDLATGDTRIVPSSWDPAMVANHLQQNPNLAIIKRLVNRIRWCVVADNVVLHDDWSPYKHFTIVPYFPYFRRGRTIGLVENLIGPQELLNKVSSQELHVINTTANSGWKVKKGGLTNMTVGELENRGAQTGLVLEVNEMDDVDKIQPNQVPSGLDRISYKAEEHIKTISGVSDYQTGFAREDVSAKAVQQNKASGSTNTVKVMDNLNRTDHILARNVLDMVQEYYTEERLVVITTDRLTRESESFKVNQVSPEGTIVNDLTLGEYGVISTTQPERDTFEDSQFDQAVALRTEVGIPIPDRFILQSSRLRDKAAIVQALEGDQESPEAQMQKELQQRAMLADVTSKEADAQSKGADAKLKVAKTQRELAAAQNEAAGPQAELAMEQQKMEMELQMKREEMEQEMELARAKMEQELQLKREEHALNMELKQQQVQADIQTKRAMALHAQANQASNPKTDGAKTPNE
jgi:hypothetical protein